MHCIFSSFKRVVPVVRSCRFLLLNLFLLTRHRDIVGESVSQQQKGLLSARFGPIKIISQALWTIWRWSVSSSKNRFVVKQLPFKASSNSKADGSSDLQRLAAETAWGDTREVKSLGGNWQMLFLVCFWGLEVWVVQRNWDEGRFASVRRRSGLISGCFINFWTFRRRQVHTTVGIKFLWTITTLLASAWRNC